MFLAYGLVKGAFLATEAAASLAIYTSKSITFRTLGALPFDSLARGLIIEPPAIIANTITAVIEGFQRRTASLMGVAR